VLPLPCWCTGCVVCVLVFSEPVDASDKRGAWRLTALLICGSLTGNNGIGAAAMWGWWRGRRTAWVFGFAFIGALLSGASPTAAFPVQAADVSGHLVCPVGWDVLITFGPLNGYCAENSGNSATACPLGTGPATHNGAPVCNITGFFANPSLLIPQKAGFAGLADQLGGWIRSILNQPEDDPWWPRIMQAQGGSGPGSVGSGNGGHAPNLGMYITPTSPEIGGGWGYGGGYAGGGVVRGSGYGISDSAGLFAPGTTTGSFRQGTGAGGVAALVDVSHFVEIPVDHTLLFKANFESSSSSTSVDSTDFGQTSVHVDNYTFKTQLNYIVGSDYATAKAVFNSGKGTETSGDGSAGNFSSAGYLTDVRLGKLFNLLDSTGGRAGQMLLGRGPPTLADGYLVGLDLSARVAYADQWISPFTDNSGFIFGRSDEHFWDVGGRAKLFVLWSGNQFVLVPYVAGTVDQLINFSGVMNIPVQPAFVGGDVINLQMARTFWGSEFGLDVVNKSGFRVGIKGFYLASTDTNVAGGTAYIKIPFDYFATPAKQKY
jgi:hypothetical protein